MRLDRYQKEKKAAFLTIEEVIVGRSREKKKEGKESTRRRLKK